MLFKVGVPSVVDVVPGITVVGEASFEVGLAGEFPDRIRLFTADAGNPTRAELHGNAAEIFLPYPSSYPVRRL